MSDHINAIYPINMCLCCKICAGNNKTYNDPKISLKEQIVEKC